MESLSGRLEVGLEATVEAVVTQEMTAIRVGSGDVPVLATPMVLALVERAAVAAVQGRLPEGQTTVGASAQLEHLAPTAVGARVQATARLVGIEGRRLTYEFELTDPGGVAARGSHDRVVVDRWRFLGSVEARGSG